VAVAASAAADRWAAGAGAVAGEPGDAVAAAVVAGRREEEMALALAAREAVAAVAGAGFSPVCNCAM